MASRSWLRRDLPYGHVAIRFQNKRDRLLEVFSSFLQRAALGVGAGELFDVAHPPIAVLFEDRGEAIFHTTPRAPTIPLPFARPIDLGQPWPRHDPSAPPPVYQSPPASVFPSPQSAGNLKVPGTLCRSGS